jgi:hypothetical protein
MAMYTIKKLIEGRQNDLASYLIDNG